MTQQREKRSSWRTWLDVLVSLVLLAAGAAVLYKTFAKPVVATRRDPPVPSAVQEVAVTMLKGNPNAPVALIVYSDFQCPFCAKFAQDIMPELDERYIKAGKLAIAFRHLPLSIHKQAFPAASVAACADTDFWRVHDALFANQASLSGSDVPKIASLAGLEVKQIEACVDKQGAERVRADMASAAQLLVKSTPTIFAGVRVSGGVKVNNVIGGAKPISEFVAVIDRLLTPR